MRRFFHGRALSAASLPVPAAYSSKAAAIFGVIAQAAERLVRPVAQQSSRRFLFTLLTLALLGAKVLHLFAHANSLTISTFMLWGSTFFAQDVILILLARLLADRFERQWAAILTATVLVVLSLGSFFMAASNASFYIATGAEIHWRQAHSMSNDAAAIRTLLNGLTAFLVIGAILITITWFSFNLISNAVGEVLRVLTALANTALSFIRSKAFPARFRRDLEAFEVVSRETYCDDDGSSGDNGSEDETAFLVGSDEEGLAGEKGTVVKDQPISLARRLAVSIPLFFMLLLSCVRPKDTAFTFLSGTLPLSPFLADSDPNEPISGLGDVPSEYSWLGNLTALAEPPPFDFLPVNSSFPGFLDWVPDSGKKHYNPEEDPLHIGNLDQDLLEPLREVLAAGKVNIKHIILFKLESTRADVFPFKKGSFIWDIIAKSFWNHVPPEIEEKIANLTRTAELLTGFPSGFDQFANVTNKHTYGGLSASNAYTTGTYTLKSIVGSVCGVTPMAVDFNREFEYHIYQPCMPHILDVLNEQPGVSNQTDDYKSWPWHSMWMQSVTETYDKQQPLTPAMGFKQIIDKEYLKDKNATHYPPKSKEINYYGYPDTELRPYLIDAIESAERDHKRLFISHLTGTTHHPWGMPGEKYDELLHHGWNGRKTDVNKYLNTIGFVDRWLEEVLDILVETGIADQTLLVMAGDHGLSLPNDGGITPYDNPHVSSFHVPLLLAHPHLPRIEISAPVISSQILPTILDLLVESSSMEQNSTHAVRQILQMYEGQSLLRPLILEQKDQPIPEPPEEEDDDEDEDDEKDGEEKPDAPRHRRQNDGPPTGVGIDPADLLPTNQTYTKQVWQFSIMNTGGSWLAVRSAAKPQFRLVIPLISALEWRFTDLETDPLEKSPLMEFSLNKLAKRIEQRWADGTERKASAEEVVAWLGDAAQVGKWWVKENWKRYRYTPKK